MSQSELGRLAFNALLQDVQRETPNPTGTEYVLKQLCAARFHSDEYGERPLMIFGRKRGTRRLPGEAAGFFLWALSFAVLPADAQTREPSARITWIRYFTVSHITRNICPTTGWTRMSSSCKSRHHRGAYRRSSWGLWEPEDGKLSMPGWIALSKSFTQPQFELF